MDRIKEIHELTDKDLRLRMRALIPLCLRLDENQDKLRFMRKQYLVLVREKTRRMVAEQRQ